MSSCVCNNNYTNNNMKYEVYTCIWYEVRITLSIEILLYKYIEQCLLLYNIIYMFYLWSITPTSIIMNIVLFFSYFLVFFHFLNRILHLPVYKGLFLFLL